MLCLVIVSLIKIKITSITWINLSYCNFIILIFIDNYLIPKKLKGKQLPFNPNILSMLAIALTLKYIRWKIEVQRMCENGHRKLKQKEKNIKPFLVWNWLVKFLILLKSYCEAVAQKIFSRERKVLFVINGTFISRKNIISFKIA